MIENYNNVRAVLNELRLALKNLRETGETYSIYIEKTGPLQRKNKWKY